MAELTSNSDRRRFTRVTPRPQEPITVQLIGEGFIEMLRARDISVGGLAVSIHHDVHPEALTSEVQVIISLPGTLSFSAKGMVRHISAAKQMFGVQFTVLRDQDRQAIERYVALRVTENGVAP